jgi:nucleoside-diphosphate-sugar epimerase
MSEKKEIILVTGSNGYLGYPIAERLAETFTVVGFDRKQPSHPPPAAECVYVDLTSEPSLGRGLQTIRDMHGDRLASVIHLAAYYDFSGSASPLYEKVTVRGTERLLRLLREMFTVEQFIFSSTMLVHAPTTPGRLITEDSPLEPTWAYPRSKVRTEEVIHAEHGDIPAVILRIAGVYDDLGHSMPLPRQIQRIFEHDLTASVFPGNLDHGQAMVHREDVIDLYTLLVASRRRLPPELTLLVAEPETLSYGAMQQTLGQLIHGEKWKTRRIPKPLAKVGAWVQQTLPLGVTPFFKLWMIDRADDHFELNIGRARTAVGWEPKRSLRETLPKIVAALEADPWAWYRENELEMPRWLREVEPKSAGGGTAELDLTRLTQIPALAGRDPSQLQQLVRGGRP